MSSWEWKRKADGVHWPDVWLWLDQLREERNLWGHVKLVPPLPSQAKKSFGSFVVVLTRHVDGGETEELIRQGPLPDPSRARAEEVVLRCIAEMCNYLDLEVYEQERAAGQGQLPF